MTTTVAGPGQLIAHIPVILGFTPTESVVVICIRARGELGLVMRVDITDCLVSDIAPTMARTLAGHLRRDGAVRVVMVSFSDREVEQAAQALGALRDGAQDVCEQIDLWAV